MMAQHQDPSPITLNHNAFAADGEVDEANLFMPDEAMVMDAEAVAASQELAAALEALLGEPVVEASDEGDAVAAEQDDDAAEELDVLEALLQESLEPLKAKAELKALRLRANSFGMSVKEKQALELKIREWEARVEWTTEANVALFTQQGCSNCGTVNKLFSSLLLRQRHRVQATSMRWVATAQTQPRMPQEVAYRLQSVPVCAICAKAQGFAVDAGYPLIVEL